jgi:glutathione S-transferase
MLKILGRSSSINVRKVLWLCAELDLPHVREDWGAGFRSPQDGEFLALNPNATVPVICDEGFVLWESNAICRYLATRHPRPPLLPRSAQARALVDQWLDWQLSELNGAWRYAFMALVRHSPEHTDGAAIRASVENWNRHMAILERHLSKSDSFVAGGSFTIADIAIALSVNRWFMAPIEHPVFPAVAHYFDRLSERPGFLAHCRNGTP